MSAPSVDALLREMHDKRLVLTFLQQLFDGSWHAAVRHGVHDYERGVGATAVAALQRAVEHADARHEVSFREIWLAGRKGGERTSLDVFA